MRVHSHIPILMYHGIRDTSPGNPWVISWDEFRQQVQALTAWGYSAIRFADLINHVKGQAALPQRPVLLTFDDGFIELYDRVFPHLFERGMCGTLFLPTGYVGKNNDWDREKAYGRARIMTKKQAAELASQGAELGSHGVSHARLTQLPVTQIRRELRQSKMELEHIGRMPVRALAYPYNAWDELTLALAEESGYQCGVMIDSKSNTVQDDLFRLRRVHVKPGEGLMAFRRKISNWYLWWRGVKGH